MRPPANSLHTQPKPSGIKIVKVDFNFEREPLISTYQFKGGGISELWQTVCYLETDIGLVGIGLGTQRVL